MLVEDLSRRLNSPLGVGMPADARREPPPQDAGYGRGRLPDGQPDDGSWALTRGLKSLFSWPPNQAAPALPPLTASGLRGLHEDGDQDGGVHRPAATSSGPSRSNADEKKSLEGSEISWIWGD